MKNNIKINFYATGVAFLIVIALSSVAHAADGANKAANVWDILGQVSLMQWLAYAILTIIGSVIGVISFVFFFLKREKILYRNLKRPIMVIEPTNSKGDKIPGTSMEIEKQMLKDNGFLNVSKEVSSYQTFDPNTNHCLVVVGYHEEMAGLDKIISKAEQKGIPIIVYTYGANIDVIAKNDFNKLKESPWVLYANFKITLLNSIFSTLATFPYYKQKNKKES